MRLAIVDVFNPVTNKYSGRITFTFAVEATNLLGSLFFRFTGVPNYHYQKFRLPGKKDRKD